jgi:hypothetical protein
VPHQICRCQRDLSSNSISAYLPCADQIAKKLSSKDLEDGWGDSWRRVFSKQVVTDTHEKVPFTPEANAFLCSFFLPDRGCRAPAIPLCFKKSSAEVTLLLRSNPLMKAQPSVFLTDVLYAQCQRPPRIGKLRRAKTESILLSGCNSLGYCRSRRRGRLQRAASVRNPVPARNT